MQPTDVTAYGCDYSAREYTPQELNSYPGVAISFVFRYIGYPGDPKCISYYPGAYRRHRDSGRPVGLFHQIEYRDFEGGYERGRTHAQVALADARNQSWDGETPILAVFDRRMPGFVRNGITYRAIPLSEVRDYVRGFVSVIGYADSGFYGFEDTMRPCVAEDWVSFRMQCGARSAHIPGIQAWQENNIQPVHLGSQTDRIELYIPLSELGGEDEMNADEFNQNVLWRQYGPDTGERNLVNIWTESMNRLIRLADTLPLQSEQMLARMEEVVERNGQLVNLLVKISDQLSQGGGLPAGGPTAVEIAKVTQDEADRRARDDDPDTGPRS